LLWSDAVHWGKQAVENVIAALVFVDSFHSCNISWLCHNANLIGIAARIIADRTNFHLAHVLTNFAKSQTFFGADQGFGEESNFFVGPSDKMKC
jgi:hypothetical protein